MEITPSIDITAAQQALLLALLQEHLPGVVVWAYGSRVKRTARRYSDLDLVVFAAREQSRAVSELKDALDESNLPFLVDLHVWDELPQSFHEVIRAEHAVLSGGSASGEPSQTRSDPSGSPVCLSPPIR